jgi:transcriptional regulator
MYLPKHFDQQDPEELATVIRQNPLATLISRYGDSLVANHIPFLLEGSPAPGSKLLAHIAKSNELWQHADAQDNVLLVFQGASAYITPNWYPSKQETHQVVPTYNYAVVHIHGKLRISHDRETKLDMVSRLTQSMEAKRASTWKVSDAPADYIESMLAAIVAIDVTIERIVGKWKISQNRSAADRTGVADGLEKHSQSEADGVMSGLVRWGKH